MAPGSRSLCSLASFCHQCFDSAELQIVAQQPEVLHYRLYSSQTEIAVCTCSICQQLHIEALMTTLLLMIKHVMCAHCSSVTIGLESESMIGPAGIGSLGLPPRMQSQGVPADDGRICAGPPLLASRLRLELSAYRLGEESW